MTNAARELADEIRLSKDFNGDDSQTIGRFLKLVKGANFDISALLRFFILIWDQVQEQLSRNSRSSVA